MNLDLLDPNVIFGIFGVGGTMLGIYQTLSARRIKSLVRERCSTRCKDLVGIVSSLSGEAAVACAIAEKDMTRIMDGSYQQAETVRAASLMNAKVDSLMTLARQLIRFCERLNEEHKEEFGVPVFEAAELKAQFAKGPCLGAMSVHLNSGQAVGQPHESLSTSSISGSGAPATN